MHVTDRNCARTNEKTSLQANCRCSRSRHKQILLYWNYITVTNTLCSKHQLAITVKYLLNYKLQLQIAKLHCNKFQIHFLNILMVCASNQEDR